MSVYECSGNLAHQRSVPPDGNMFNPERIQVSDRSRETELAAEKRMQWGDDIPATHTHRMNGQTVDLATHLMCSRCCTWKLDKEFTRDKHRSIRRKRSYYCKDCLNRLNAGYREARLTG